MFCSYSPEGVCWCLLADLAGAATTPAPSTHTLHSIRTPGMISAATTPAPSTHTLHSIRTTGMIIDQCCFYPLLLAEMLFTASELQVVSVGASTGSI